MIIDYDLLTKFTNVDELEAAYHEVTHNINDIDIEYGIDRVLAIYPSGIAYAWHQINSCGSAAFSGEVLPENCPPNESE